MNVTIKISDEVCREARHRAVDEGLSLSGWVASLIAKEVGKQPHAPSKSILELLGCDELADAKIDFPRVEIQLREVDFS